MKAKSNETPLAPSEPEEETMLLKRKAMEEMQKAMDERQKYLDNRQRFMENWEKRRESKVYGDPISPTSQMPNYGPEVGSVGSNQQSYRSRASSASASSRIRDPPGTTRDRSRSLGVQRADPWPVVPAIPRAAQGQRPISGQMAIPTTTYPALEGPQFM